MAPKGATTYAMSLKEGSDIVFKTQAQNYEDAYYYFRKLKQMSKEDFKELFIVSEVKNKK